MYAKQVRERARRALSGNWLMAVIVTLVAGILGGVNASIEPWDAANATNTAANTASSMNGASVGAPALASPLPDQLVLAVLAALSAFATIALVIYIVMLIFGGAVRQGLCQFNINLVKKDAPAEFGVLFSKFFNFGKCFLLNLAMTFFIFLWTLLFIIPGIIATYRYAMAPYIMAQNPNIGVMEAINKSKAMMDGHKAQLFYLDLSFIGWFLLCMLTLGVGLILLNPYREAAYATFYLNLSNQLLDTQG